MRNKNSTKAFDENIWFNQLPSRYFCFIFKSVPINLFQNVGGCFTYYIITSELLCL